LYALFAFNGVLSPSMGRQKLSRGQRGYWLTAQQVESCCMSDHLAICHLPSAIGDWPLTPFRLANAETAHAIRQDLKKGRSLDA
jgi:hypothetical protein